MTQPERGLHVVAVVGPFPVASKTFVMDQIVGLVEAGHHVRVLADPPLPGQEMPAEQVPVQVRDALTYRAVAKSRLTRRLRGVLAAGEALVRAPRATVRLLAAREHRLGRRRELVEALLALRGFADADVFHCHFGHLGADVVEARDRLGLRGRVATAFHGFDVSSYVQRSGPEAFARLFASGDLFLPISDHWRRRIIELGAPPERVEVQRMGVDVARFAPVERRRPDQAPLRVLSVCRLVEKKGVAHGLQAVRELRGRGVEVEYGIVGSGPEREALEALVRSWGLGAHVRFLGTQPRERVAALMAASDVLLCPSVTAADGDAEGIPMVLMEAMATAMPVVASRHSGIPELVEHGRSGLLAAERDSGELADHLQLLHRDPARRQELGRNGRARVEERFSVQRLVAQLDERFRELAPVGASR